MQQIRLSYLLLLFRVCTPAHAANTLKLSVAFVPRVYPSPCSRYAQVLPCFVPCVPQPMQQIRSSIIPCFCSACVPQPPSRPRLTSSQRADLQAELAATSGLGAVAMFDELQAREEEQAKRELELLQKGQCVFGCRRVSVCMVVW